MSLNSSGPKNTRQVKNGMSTGVVSGMAMSINGSNNKQVDISSGTVRFLDNTTDPLKPVFVEKFFPGSTEDIITTGVGTHYSLKQDLTVEKETFTGLDTATEMRSKIELGAAVHFGDAPIVRTLSFFSNVAINTQLNICDLSRAVGRIRQSGLALSANGANLSIDRATGVEYSPFFENFTISALDPSTLALPAVAPVSFFHSWRDGSGGWNTSATITVIAPSVYDDGTGGVSGPAGAVANNQAQIMRVGEVNLSTIVEYGQTKYNSIAAAVDALPTEQHDTSIFAANTALRGYLIVRGGATDLSDAADALFFAPASDFVLQRI